jgi:hypothetical protein
MDEIYPENESKSVRYPKAEFHPGNGNIEQRNRTVKRLNRIGFHIRIWCLCNKSRFRKIRPEELEALKQQATRTIPLACANS